MSEKSKQVTSTDEWTNKGTFNCVKKFNSYYKLSFMTLKHNNVKTLEWTDKIRSRKVFF